MYIIVNIKRNFASLCYFSGMEGLHHQKKMKKDFNPPSKEELEKRKKYLRGDVKVKRISKNVENKKLLDHLKHNASDRKMAARKAAEAEVLLPEQPGYLEVDDEYRTSVNVPQSELKRHVDVRTAQNSFELSLDQFGPYRVSYTKNGAHMLLAGEKGHIGMLSWKSKKLVLENHVKDRIYAATFLQNETWFATAQSKYVHIYDKQGLELHVLREHFKATQLDYLPYHWLLVSSGSAGIIRWHDVSTGKIVAQRNAHNGPCVSLKQNPWNAIMCQGHAKGVVTMWAPSMSEPAVKMLCHRGPIVSIAIDRSGNTMVTSGLDSNINVWDLRYRMSLVVLFGV